MNNKYYKFISDDLKQLFEKLNVNYFKNKSLIITGGSGLIGHYLVIFFHNLMLKKKINKVYIIHKSPLQNYFKQIKNKNFVFIKKNLCKDINNLPKADVIIHGAGYGQPLKFLKNEIETLLLNSQVTLNLLKKVKKNGKFIFLSSSEVYSGLFKNWEEKNIGKTNTDNARACYIEGKRAGETFVEIFRRNMKIDAKSIRVNLVYGPGVKKNDLRAMYMFSESAIKHKKIILKDKGKALRSYIYITDAILMIMKIMINGKSSLYNLGGKKLISILSLAKLIARITNSTIRIKIQKNKKLSSAPIKAKVSIKKYEKEFGKIRPVNLKTGLKKTIQWLKLI